jgi:Fe-S-cluster containining protein
MKIAWSGDKLFEVRTVMTRVTHQAENIDASRASSVVPAGNFVQWLAGAEASLRFGTIGADVPCGTCRGCCRSSMFIHIKPEETRTLNRIPRALLFPAPAQPKGHLLMGYNDQGQCPMFVNNQCSIYEDRPQTCRDYDCRVFAATGIAVDEQNQPEIANRVKQWVFEYESDEDGEQHKIVKQAASFLEKNRDLFPPGSLPGYPVQLAALSIRIYRVFSEMTANAGHNLPAPSDAAIARAVLAEFGGPYPPANP